MNWEDKHFFVKRWPSLIGQLFEFCYHWRPMTRNSRLEQDVQTFLVVVRTDKAYSLGLGRRFQIHSDIIRLGNGPDVDIPVGLGWTEKCQVEVCYKDRAWHIFDTTNFGHLCVNGVSVKKIRVCDGDLIQINEFAFEFSMSRGIKFEFFEHNEKARQEDILTGAYNRGYLLSVLGWEISRYKQSQPGRRNKRLAVPPMSLIFIDVDHFGAFNKRHDHQVGDEVLKTVVERMKSRVRSTDVVARYGGEEFFIYLPHTDKEEAMNVAEQIRLQVASTPFTIDEKRTETVTISLGVSQYEGGMDAVAFVRAADLKMKSAKNKGRNQVFG